ncbi:MAG: hypothetical protein IPJ19_14345 [Planctomycetes bacterium]|nr:hypothetical protein [Planctomycetota bacterium]
MNARLPAALAATLFALPCSLAQSPIERTSLSSSGQEPNAASWSAGLSADGRFALLLSYASNLVANDTNGGRDVFLRDRLLGTTERVNVSSSGAQANAAAVDCALSADGRFACFSSTATNLIPNDTNPANEDVFVRDLGVGTTEVVSVDSAGVQLAGTSYWGSLSADGRFVLFRSNAAVPAGLPVYRLWRHDRQTGQTDLVDLLPASYTRQSSSNYPSMSADGRFVAFQVLAQTTGTSTYRARIFVFDAQSGSAIEASTSPAGAPANLDSMQPLIAPDASVVAFLGWSSNLVAGFTPDNAGALFVHDLASGANEVVSTDSSGNVSHGSNFFVHGLSNGGRYISLVGQGSALVTGDTNASWDVFVKDRVSGSTRRVSVTPSGQQLDEGGWDGSLTPDGRYLSLYTTAAMLVAGDTNGVEDSFVVDLQPAAAQVYCSALVNSQGCLPAISGTGTASASSAQPFTIACVGLLNQRPVRMAYSVTPAAIVFQGGLLCIDQPITRLVAQSSGGSASGTDCSGVFNYDFNPRIQSGLDPRLVPGTLVCAQVFARDPLAAGGYSLSAGLAFSVQP